MITRVTDNIKFNMLINNMFTIQGKYGELMEKLSTQKTINRPSDDPIGTNDILDFRTISNTIEQYRSNITDANIWLNLSSTNLSGLRNIVDEATRMAVSESGATADSETRLASAATLTSMIDEALSMLNAKNGDNYLFGGSVTDVKPFSATYSSASVGVAAAATTNSFNGTITAGGTYTATINKNYAVKIVTGGDIASATYKVSSDGGMTWGATQNFPAKVVQGNVTNTASGAPITAATLWSAMDAVVQVNDTIDISGIDNDGNAVGPITYTVNAADTVQDLLDQIETTFGGTATASIVDGSITLTDNATGASLMALTLDENNEGAGSNLDFGTVSASTTTAINLGDGISMTFTSGSVDLAANDTFMLNGYAAGYYRGNGDRLNAVIGNKNTMAYNITGTEAFTGQFASTEVTGNVVFRGSVANKASGVNITAATNWDEIDGANVVNGDTITVSGFRHDGTSVTSTFTIADVGMGTVGDLLNHINGVTSFDGTATASIVNGKITLTDNTSGASLMELTLNANNQGGGSLGFGQIASTFNDSIVLTRGSTAGSWTITSHGSTTNPVIMTQTAEALTIDADNNGTSDITVKLTGTWNKNDTINVSLTDGDGVATSAKATTSFRGSGSVDLLSTLNALKEALQVTDQDHAANLIYAQIDNLENSGMQLLQYETQAGAKMNSLQTTSSNHDALDLQITNMLADIENADLTQLIMNFQMKQIAMQASYSMASQIGKMTIMDYL